MNHFITEINIPYTRLCALYKYAHVIHKSFFIQSQKHTVVYHCHSIPISPYIGRKWCIITYYVPNTYIIIYLYSYNEIMYICANEHVAHWHTSGNKHSACTTLFGLVIYHSKDVILSNIQLTNMSFFCFHHK